MIRTHIFHLEKGRKVILDPENITSKGLEE